MSKYLVMVSKDESQQLLPFDSLEMTFEEAKTKWEAEGYEVIGLAGDVESGDYFIVDETPTKKVSPPVKTPAKRKVAKAK